MKKRLQKIKKSLGKITQSITSNKLTILNTALLLYVAVRVEQIHTAISGLFDIVVLMSVSILQATAAAKAQFGMAIESILSLFGGSPS